jgi:hypothetical protein
MSVTFSIVLFGFTGWQLYLVGTAQTQIEFYDHMHERKRAKENGQVSSAQSTLMQPDGTD